MPLSLPFLCQCATQALVNWRQPNFDECFCCRKRGSATAVVDPTHAKSSSAIKNFTLSYPPLLFWGSRSCSARCRPSILYAIRHIYLHTGLTIWFARLCMPPIYLFPNPSAHAKHTPSTRRRAAPHSRVTCRLCAPSTPCWCYPLARAGTCCSPCVPPSPDCAEYGVRTACARCTRRAVCTRRRLRRRRHSPSCPPLSRVCRRYFFSSAGSSACLHLASCNHGESSVPRAGEASALVGSVRARASLIIAV